MHNVSNQLLGKWILQLTQRYFIEQKKVNGDKLFIKIEGIEDSAWKDVLQAFQDGEELLAQYFKPVIRTVTQIEEFEAYQCQQYETTTWLRNNTPSGNALLIFMNDRSSEAQSLENIFTIDEARLLSKEGLEDLYHIFSEAYKCYGDEMKLLKQFLGMYNRMSEPQLRSVLTFLAAVIQDGQLSMIDKIQQNMNSLLLFRDHRLTFQSEGYARLQRNYQLSRLEGRAVNKDKLIDSLYRFLEKEAGSPGSFELWDKVSPDLFRKQALDFIHNQSNELLQYEYELISSALFMKVGKPKLSEKFNDFKEGIELQNELTPDRNRLISETLEAIDEKRNPDKIQQFFDEFTEELDGHPKFQKELKRILGRIQQKSEYTEIYEAILQEAILLLEEYADECAYGEVSFVLTVDSQISASLQASLKFHLLQLNELTFYIHFDADSLGDSVERDKTQDVTFRIQLRIANERIGANKFTLVKAFIDAKLPEMIEIMQESDHIPYIRTYYGSDTNLIDIVGEIKERVSGYVVTGDADLGAAASSFYGFLDYYTTELRRGLQQGLCSIPFNTLEEKLEKLLSQVEQSPLLSKQIFQYISCLGAVDHYNCKISESVGYAESRILTLLNPIRLLSYAKRLLRIKFELEGWIEQQKVSASSIEDMDIYVEQTKETMSHLSPHYFVIDGVLDQYLLEQHELMGEGVFTLNGKSGGEEKLVTIFAEELLSTVKAYLDVYPYAKDCLDIVFMYCPHAEYVERAIDQIFKSTEVRKVKAIVHCESNGATIHSHLNGWISQEPNYMEQYFSFPRVEIQVIAEQNLNATMHSITQYLQDADIGVLINYFGQTSHIQYKFEKVQVMDSLDWFDTIYMEPLQKNDAIKRISLISEKLPKVMQYFYQMQYILSTNDKLTIGEHYLLRNVISIQKQADTELINYMHDQFNWSLFIDRHLDKALLRQVSLKAQIIKYKTRTGNQKKIRTLVSSSKYIRKLANELADHEYYDRLHQKFVLLLKNKNIDSRIIVQASEGVKEISGGVVLRAIGPGKFAHEMMSIYLATEARSSRHADLITWSVCDELPWFTKSGRRPDLVCTSINRMGVDIHIHFELIELKFISHTIFEQERLDAVKQVKAGIELYTKRFMFQSQHPASAELWRKELVTYLLDYGTYSPEEALLLKELQDISINHINVSISGAIDTFVYTSNMLDLTVMEGHVNGYQTELLHNEYVNHIYNRSYILKTLGATKEDVVPDYEQLQELPEYVSNRLDQQEQLEDSLELGPNYAESNEAHPTSGEHREENAAWHGVGKVAEVAVSSETEYSVKNLIQETQSTISAADVYSNQTVLPDQAVSSIYPEQLALVSEIRTEDEQVEDIKHLVDDYQRKIRANFNQRGIPIKIVEAYIGVSVIRLVLEIPSDKSYKSIENQAQNIYLWLQLSSIPFIGLSNGRINIDINRAAPETVYFEAFMEQIRVQYPAEKLRGKLIAPIGIGQLRELIVLDLSSSNTPHLLIGGTTGSGKSVTMNAIILSMMCMYEPSEVQFIFIDPKKVEFLAYENRTHTRRVITEIEDAILMLEQQVEEMEQRYTQFALEGVNSIEEYIEVTEYAMPRIVIVFDEFADFMEREKSLSSRVETTILRLGAKARAAGIHLIICTQNPKADIVPTNIRNNLPARLALKAADHHASKIIISEEGAERLGGKGDFLIKMDLPEINRGKSPFLTSRVKRALLQYFSRK